MVINLFYPLREIFFKIWLAMKLALIGLCKKQNTSINNLLSKNT